MSERVERVLAASVHQIHFEPPIKVVDLKDDMLTYSQLVQVIRCILFNRQISYACLANLCPLCYYNLFTSRLTGQRGYTSGRLV